MPTLPTHVQIVLLDDGEETTLTRDEGEAVVQAFEQICVAARKHRAWSGRGGRLLVIDAQAVGEIRAFLQGR